MDMSLEVFIAIVGPQSEELIKSFINAKIKALEIKTQAEIKALEIKALEIKAQADKDAKIAIAKINASKSQVIFFLINKNN